MDLRQLSLDILKACKDKVDEAEVFCGSSESTTIEILNQKIEALESSTDAGLGLRVIKNKRQGFAFCSDFAPEVIEDTIEQAIANAENSAEDKFYKIATPSPKYPKLKLFDPAIEKMTVEEKIKLAKEIEKSAYAFDPRIKKTEKVQFSSGEGEMFLVSTNGHDLYQKANHLGGFAEIIAEDKNEAESGSSGESKLLLKEFDPVKIGKEAGQKAIELLGAQKISSQKIPIVLDPEIGAELIASLSPNFSSENTQKGKSLFIGKVGQKVASSQLTIIDDGTLENHLGSEPFDGEGIATQRNVVIEKGRLNTLLYNTYTALKEGKQSTGNASRGGFSGGIYVGTTNLFVEAGKKSQKEILSGIKKGVYITRVMGMHTVNPISGEFSIGASGLMIENGKKTFPVRGITIAGNLIHMLEAIEEIGSDLRFFSSIGCPTILINDISLGGE